jgi:hypothetical protein
MIALPPSINVKGLERLILASAPGSALNAVPNHQNEEMGM